MNVDYKDGRRELLTGLTPDQVADHFKRVVADPEFERAEITPEVKEMLFETNGEMNRHARRKWLAQRRKERKD